MSAGPFDCIPLLACPVCAAPLHQSDRALRCPNRHSFDIAREGYVNLLPTGHGKSGITGDSAEMVDARRRIFAREFFAPLAERLAAIAATVEPRTVLDAGCGTGYYLDYLHNRLVGDAEQGTGETRERCWIGTDVSKPAIRRAARDHRDLLFLLNDIKHRLTIQGGTIDLLLNIFAPRNVNEFARVLAHDGVLLVVIPADDHLRELRARFDLLDIGAEKRERTIDQLAAQFTLESDEELAYSIVLGEGDAADLLRMTPNYWHLPPEVFSAAEELKGLAVSMGFRILKFRKRG